VILDSTAHILKFAVFQEMYFQDEFGPEFQVTPRPELKNVPTVVSPPGLRKFPAPGSPLSGEDMKEFIRRMTEEIARILDLEEKPLK